VVLTTGPGQPRWKIPRCFACYVSETLSVILDHMKTHKVTQKLTPPGRPPGMPRAEWRRLCEKNPAEAAQMVWSQAVAPVSQAPSGNMPKQTNVKERASKHHVEKFAEQYTSSLAGSTGLIVGTISVNPGDVNVFTRLAKLSELYLEWRFRSFRVRYVPNGSAFAANNQTGEVVLSANADFYSARSSSIAIARARTPSAAGNAWVPLVFDVPSEILGTWRRLRAVPSSYGADANMFDFLLEVAIYQTPNSNNIGYLEFTGEVEYRQGYFQQTVNAALTNRAFGVLQTVAQTVSSGVAATLLTTNSTSNNNALITGCHLLSGSTTLLHLHGGSFLVILTASCQATTMTQIDIAINPGVNATFSNRLGGAAVAGSTFSCAFFEASTSALICVGEDDTVAFDLAVNIVGTGTIQVTSWSLTVVSL
jgi:hypothetical protein